MFTRHLSNETVTFGFLAIGRDDGPPYSWYDQQENNLFGNMRSFTCKYSINSISLVLAGLMETAMQSGSDAEA